MPGPDNDLHWTLGVVNPSGLIGKSHLVAALPADVLAFSETHLTTSARRNFVCNLRSTDQGFTHFISGCPLQPRSQVSDAGDWAGVAVASKFPCRGLSADWPPDLFESGRIQFCAVHVHSFWLSGATIYGYPAGVTHPHAWERTMAMLDFAVARVLHGCVGPRFLAGDWNFEQNQITCWQTLLDAGWIEVQDLVETRYGTKPRNTCKSKTRKDFLWISPELARHFRHLHFHEVFADHVVMCADFSHHAEFGDRWLWPRPTPIDWTSVPDLSLPVDFSLGAPSDLYQHLWEQKENLAQQTLQDTWRPSMAGRASIRQPIFRKGWNSPLKKSRTQDIQPAFHGVSLQHSRWFKQLRRLESYVRWTSSTRPDRDGEHGANLWRSILLGTGFKPSFASWWISRAYRCPGDVASIPNFPPTA